MYRLQGVAEFSQVEKKSRFRAVAGAIDSVEDAGRFVANHSDPSANHNCWAWRLGQACRFNDDGEPGGTAGKPILQAIDGQSLDRVAVVVTRWFGGILLGSGGLMRAYGGTAAVCLRHAARIEIVETTGIRVLCAFSDFPLLKARLLAMAGVAIRAEVYGGDGVDLTLDIPDARIADVTRMITDLTSGRATILTA
jgi:uncharacterized YigZ family protein